MKKININSILPYNKNIFLSSVLYVATKEVVLLKNTTFSVATDIIYNCFEFLEKFTSSKIFFIRKNKMFNKGRYSRNRQLYRTGVY